MREKLEIDAVVLEDGNLPQASRFKIRRVLASFAGKSVKIIIQRTFRKRTNSQNAFYWGFIVPFFQDLFYREWCEIHSVKDTHEILKAACNYREIVNIATGEVLKVPMSTTELSTKGWMEYEQKLAQLAMDFFGEVLPEPNEQLKIEFK